jgi:hypothetical protein
MQKTKFVLGVDLDGTVADFYGGLRPIAAEWLGVAEGSLPENVSWGLPEWSIPEAPGGYLALHKFAVTQRNLFKNLKPFSGAAQALRELSREGIRIRIIGGIHLTGPIPQPAQSQSMTWTSAITAQLVA